MERLVVTGALNTGDFVRAKLIAEAVAAANKGRVSLEIKELIPAEWDRHLEVLSKDKPIVGGAVVRHEPGPRKSAPAVLNVDDFAALARERWSVQEPLSDAAAYAKAALDAHRRYIANPPPPPHTGAAGSAFCFLDVTIGGEAAGTIVLELFTGACPKTCQNFSGLCNGAVVAGNAVGYAGTPIHRVVKGGWVQGGDLAGGHGDGGTSLWGADFEDENFVVKHDRPGVLGMCNKGAGHTNGSQFYITTAPAPYLDKRTVAFGRVHSGWPLLRRIEALETVNQRPSAPAVIASCGAYSV
eukprot:m51a1_g9262 hypothetical protein (298) ;mRNA; f:67383-68479